VHPRKLSFPLFLATFVQLYQKMEGGALWQVSVKFQDFALS